MKQLKILNKQLAILAWGKFRLRTCERVNTTVNSVRQWCLKPFLKVVLAYDKVIAFQWQPSVINVNSLLARNSIPFSFEKITSLSCLNKFVIPLVCSRKEWGPKTILIINWKFQNLAGMVGRLTMRGTWNVFFLWDNVLICSILSPFSSDAMRLHWFFSF